MTFLPKRPTQMRIYTGNHLTVATFILFAALNHRSLSSASNIDCNTLNIDYCFSESLCVWLCFQQLTKLLLFFYSYLFIMYGSSAINWSTYLLEESIKNYHANFFCRCLWDPEQNQCTELDCFFYNSPISCIGDRENFGNCEWNPNVHLCQKAGKVCWVKSILMKIMSSRFGSVICGVLNL